MVLLCRCSLLQQPHVLRNSFECDLSPGYSLTRYKELCEVTVYFLYELPTLIFIGRLRANRLSAFKGCSLLLAD